MPGVVSVVLQVTGALWWGGVILLALFIAAKGRQLRKAREHAARQAARDIDDTIDEFGHDIDEELRELFRKDGGR